MELMKNARPLAMPVALLMELDRNGASLDVYRELEDLYRTANGYECPWGQIIKSDSGASEGLPACREWEFILTLPLARFHAVGGNLSEVSDLCLSLLDRLRYLATDGLSLADQASAPPECLEFSEGWSSFSAFGVSAFGSESIEVVGKWLEEVFVPVVMPLILDYLAESAVSTDESQ